MAFPIQAFSILLRALSKPLRFLSETRLLEHLLANFMDLVTKCFPEGIPEGAGGDPPGIHVLEGLPALPVKRAFWSISKQLSWI